MAVSNMNLIHTNWCCSYVKHKPWRAVAVAAATAAAASRPNI